jgi:hypothetical protein
MDSPTASCLDDRPPALAFRKATPESRDDRLQRYAATKILEDRSAVAVLLEYKQEGMAAKAPALSRARNRATAR